MVIGYFKGTNDLIYDKCIIQKEITDEIAANFKEYFKNMEQKA